MFTEGENGVMTRPTRTARNDTMNPMTEQTCWCGEAHPKIGDMLNSYNRVSAMFHKNGQLVSLGLRDIRIKVPPLVPPRLTGTLMWKNKS